MKKALFQSPDEEPVVVHVKRRGPKNSRVVFSDGHDELVPNNLLNFLEDQGSVQEAEESANESRVVTQTPLRKFYRTLRKLKGGRDELYLQLISLLRDRHGPKDAYFLAELFGWGVGGGRRACPRLNFRRPADRADQAHLSAKRPEQFVARDAAPEMRDRCR